MADGRVSELLADRPDLESALESVLAVDEEQNTWTFDDVPIDSGRFGELVGEGVVEKVDSEYRLADPEAVRAAVQNDGGVEAGEASGRSSHEFQLPTVDAAGAAMLVGALSLVVAGRAFLFGRVFREDAVVLGANDPYYYRYWVEQLLGPGASATDLPGAVANGEPLLVVTLSALSSLLGGVEAVGFVMAIYPVVSALIVAGFLYWIGMATTEDRRVALAAVVILAFTPGHALRTALGFADHHAFDYIWLALTATSLVALGRVSTRADLRRPATWLATIALGVGVSAQTLAWEAGPLLILPVGLVVAGRVLLAVHADRSPGYPMAPTVAGLLLAAALTLGGHLLGWQAFQVAITPTLLVAGTLGLIAVGTISRRFGRSAREVLVAELVVGLIGILGMFVVVPSVGRQLTAGVGLLGRTDGIAEVQPLFSPETFGFLLLFGFVLFLAIPTLVWFSLQLTAQPRWVTVCVYGWFFFGLALLQVRFVGELAMFTALFAGLGFVWLASKVDLTGPPAVLGGLDRTRSPSLADWTPGRPAASTVLAVLALFAMIGGFGVIQTAVKVDQITTETAKYETAKATEANAMENGWTEPSNGYVLSNWGDNRLYNYFVTGDSDSYGYAEATFDDFVSERDPAAAASLLHPRVRYIVTDKRSVRERRAIGTRLHDHYGSRTGTIDGLARYRAIFASAGGAEKSFLRVPGATLEGSTAGEQRVALETGVEIPGAAFRYTRQVRTSANGSFAVGVAYPGTYELSTENRTWSVQIPESAVLNGETVDASP